MQRSDIQSVCSLVPTWFAVFMHRSSRATNTEEEVLVKLLRLLANVAIHPALGAALAAKQATADALLAVLQCYSFEAAEELVLNAAAALTNLSYYQEPTNKVGQLSLCVMSCHNSSVKDK